jgi:hypothetical protein
VGQAADQNIGVLLMGETALISKLTFPAAIAFLLVGSAACRAQPFGSKDEIAAKNIFIAVNGAFKCDSLTPVLSRIREYAQQNGVSIDSLRDQAERYKNQRAYAVTVVDSHIKVGDLASLCKSIIQDFGPNGKSAIGLIAEVRPAPASPMTRVDAAIPMPEAANLPPPSLKEIRLADTTPEAVRQIREYIALMTSVVAAIVGYFSARRRAAEGSKGSTIIGALIGGAVGGIASALVTSGFEIASLIGRSIACTLIALPFSFGGSISGRRKRRRAPPAAGGEQQAEA